MRWCCGLVCVALGFGACGAASGKAPASGISGRVLVGPTCPVETYPPRPGCAPRPLVATLRIRAVGSQSPSKRVRSGADGRFRLALAPATYMIQPLPASASPLPRPPAAVRLKVRAGRFAHITVYYDSGIR